MMILICALFLTSMLNGQVKKTKIYVNTFEPQKNQKVLIGMNVIDHIHKPIIPLVDAAVISSMILDLSLEIDKLMNVRVNTYDEDTKSLLNLKSAHEIKVIYLNQSFPDSLLNVSHEKDSLSFVLSQNSKMIFPINNGKFNNFLSKPNNYSQLVSEICTNQNSDYLLISYSYVKITKPDMPNSCRSQLLSELYILDKNGELVFKGFGESEKKYIGIYTGENRRQRSIDALNRVLDDYYPIMNEILGNINWM